MATPTPMGVMIVGCILCTRTNGAGFPVFIGEMRAGILEDGARSAPYGRRYNHYWPSARMKAMMDPTHAVGIVTVGCILCTRTNGTGCPEFMGEMTDGDANLIGPPEE